MDPDKALRSPASQFRFCPQCGAPDPEITAARRLRCGRCGFVYFFNCATAVGAFVFHGERLILCVRGKEPGRGMLGVPGGFIDFGETVEEGLRREIREELGIEVADFRYLGSSPNDYRYAQVDYKTCDAYFTCEASDISGIRAADDVADYVLIALAEVDPARFAFDSARRAFGLLREWSLSGDALSEAGDLMPVG